MSKVLITEGYLEDIANAIRYKNGGQITYTPAQMAQAIMAIPTTPIVSDTYAFIKAQYDSGDTCVATNGTIVLHAEDTSGYYVFGIPTPSLTPETWTVSSTNASETVTRTVDIVNKGDSINVSVVHDSIVRLKADMLATEYCYLSNAIGDGASEGGRYFTRTTADPPALFIDYYHTTGYNGYGVVSLSNNVIAHTASTWGQLNYVDSYTTTKGTTYYGYVMAGQWQNQFPTYTVDGISYSRGNRSSYAYLNENGLRGSSQYTAEFESFIDRLALLSS